MGFSPEGTLAAGRYRLIEEIGRGASGVVWRAFDTRENAVVAVRRLADDGDVGLLYRRVWRETQIVGRLLAYPDVVIPSDVVEEEGHVWVVMEYVPGPSLERVLDGGPLAPRSAAGLAQHLLALLRVVHEAGIVHRNIRPTNIVLGARTRLMDIGVGATGEIPHDPRYVAPERFEGERLSTASDVWELGATLYTAVRGHAPYDRPSLAETLTAALTEPVPAADGPLAPLLARMLERRPGDRPTAGRALAELQGLRF